MPRAAPLALAVLLACSAAPAAGPSPSPSPAAAPTTAPSTPTATVTASPTAARTPIALPNTVLIDAPSATAVWVLVGEQAQGGRLFRSSDRGDSWQERSVPPVGPVELSFIDDREGWAMVPTGGCCVPPPAGAQCGAPVALSHTTDGAATWQQITPAGLVPPGPCKSTVRFADAQRGYIAACDPNGSPLVYRTTDGGRAWTGSQRFPDPPGFTTRPGGPTLGVGKIAAFGPVVLVVAFLRDPPANGQSYIYRSTDSGASWSYASAAPNAFQDIAFVTATRWLQLSAPGDSKETTDGGGSWHAFATDYRQAAPIGPTVVFGDAQVGYATVRGSIQRTVDGGLRWSQIRTPGTF